MNLKTLLFFITTLSFLFFPTITKAESQKVNQRSQIARENISPVSQKVEELISSPRIEKGIGQEVRQVAQAQKEVQTKIEENLDKLDLRRGWLKKIIGPDYKAIKDLQKELNQNQLRIQQLEQLQNKLTNQADKTMIQETIQVLNQENTSLQEKISSEEKITNLFGWLFKRFIN